MKSIGVTRLTLALAVVAACGDGEGITAPRPGTVVIVTVTSGPEPDPDGYTVQIDAGDARAIGASSSLTAPGIAAGPHTLQLAEVAANCSVAGPNPRAVVVTSGETTTAGFEITCVATTGSIEVVTTTAGSGLDPDGYVVQIESGDAQPIGVSATLLTSGVAPGPRSVRLDEVAANCTISSPNPQTAVVTAGEITRVLFELTCATTGSILIATPTTGSGLDPDGFLVSVDGSVTQAIGINTTLLLEGLSPGAHVVELSGVASNCNLDGENPLTVDVVLGGTTASNFTVVCLGADALIAFGSVDFDLEAIFTVRPDGSDLRRLSPPGEFDRDPVWSPDGSRILFGQGDDIFVMNADGTGRSRLVAGRPEAGGYRWSPDGRSIAFVQGGVSDDEFFQELWIMQADGADPRRLATDGAAPSWSPDSRRIAYEGDGQIRVINADGTGDARVTQQEFGGFEPAWSPDGSRIAFITTLDDPPNRPADRHIFLVNPDGSSLMNLTRGRGDDEGPVWSPDGSLIAFVTSQGDEPASEIFVMDREGGGRTNLTRRRGFEVTPVWSPDGSKIVFNRFGEDDAEIFIMNADGSGQTNVSNRPGSDELAPDWGGQSSSALQRQSVARGRSRILELERLRRRP